MTDPLDDIDRASERARYQRLDYEGALFTLAQQIRYEDRRSVLDYLRDATRRHEGDQMHESYRLARDAMAKLVGESGEEEPVKLAG